MLFHYSALFRYGVLLGIVTGTTNPGVKTRVYMGLGYGLDIPNPT